MEIEQPAWIGSKEITYRPNELGPWPGLPHEEFAITLADLRGRTGPS